MSNYSPYRSEGLDPDERSYYGYSSATPNQQTALARARERGVTRKSPRMSFSPFKNTFSSHFNSNTTNDSIFQNYMEDTQIEEEKAQYAFNKSQQEKDFDLYEKTLKTAADKAKRAQARARKGSLISNIGNLAGIGLDFIAPGAGRLVSSATNYYVNENYF